MPRRSKVDVERERDPDGEADLADDLEEQEGTSEHEAEEPPEDDEQSLEGRSR